MRDESNDCSCVSDTLTIECTVMSGLGTIWRGSALNCTSSNNEINFLESNIIGDHDQTCNNGMIIGRVIKHEGTNYTSQLNVTLTSDLIGQIIECASDNGSQIAIFNTTLHIRKWACSYKYYILLRMDVHYQEYNIILLTLPNAVPFPPPDEISLALINFGLKEITFSWSPVAPDCHYNILASNCGSCPTTTNHTNVTCTYLPSDVSVCTLALETVLCGNIAGKQSKPLILNITETLMNEITSSKKGVFCTSLKHYQ